MKVGIVGASGYTGGELLRLLLFHPKVEVAIAVSREYAGEYLFRVHPNLRGVTDLKFCPLDVPTIVKECEIVFTATPHGATVALAPKFLEAGLRVVDLSADFRLREPADYPKWYGWEHSRPDLLKEAVYGLTELHKDEIRKAKLVACPGCIATSAILELAPLIKADIVDKSKVVVDSKIGSTGAGGKPSLSTHHAERFGVVRPYKLTGHRHTGEIEQELSNLANDHVTVALSCHAVNIVRGISSTAHTFLTKDVKEVDIWKIYRSMYQNEPFIRLVKDRKGIYRLPDPKIVIGSNFCDIGFEFDTHANRLVVVSAIDNLMKGAAGQAVQNLNVMLGIDEKTGLEAPGYHPV